MAILEAVQVCDFFGPDCQLGPDALSTACHMGHRRSSDARPLEDFFLFFFDDMNWIFIFSCQEVVTAMMTFERKKSQGFDAFV